jgi:hypothetical protein
MNKLLVALLSVSASVAGAAPADEQRTVGEFTGVHVGSGIQAKVETAASPSVVLHGEPDVLKRVRTDVKGGVLQVIFDPSSRPWTDSAVSVTVRMSRASSLAVSGGAQMEAAVPATETFQVDSSGGGRLALTSAIAAKKFALNASGGSRITLAGVDSAQASFDLSGQARATVSGKADGVRVSMSGQSDLDAAGLQAVSLAVDGSGGSRAAVRAGKSVTGSLSGGSRIRVPASADVRVETTGGADVLRDL